DGRPLVLVARLGDADGGTEAVFGQRRVPLEDVVLGDQQVGVAISGQVDEAKVWIAPIDVGGCRKRSERLPGLFACALEEARLRALKNDAMGLPVARKIEKLVMQRRGLGDGWQRCDLGKCVEACGYGRAAVVMVERGGAEFAFVMPPACAFGEDARGAFAVEVDPFVSDAVDTGGQINQALAIDFPDIDTRIALGQAVLKLQRRQ